MSTEDLKNLGPLASLVGTWEGDKGQDRAPSPDRGVENNPFRERIVFENIGQVDNHEQSLYGLRYRTMAWEQGDEDPFHEEVGYWLWDATNKQVMKCFNVPRGISLIAGGTTETDSKEFKMSAELGSPTYGICSNKFLDQEFKTLRFEVTVTVHNDSSFSYDEVTELKIKGQDEIFLHTDKNTLNKI